MDYCSQYDTNSQIIRIIFDMNNEVNCFILVVFVCGSYVFRLEYQLRKSDYINDEENEKYANLTYF